MTTLRELEFIAAIADALPAAIWVGSAPRGETVYTNGEFREILGLTAPPDAERGNYVGPYGVHTVDGAPYPEHRMPFERALAARATVEVDDLVIHRHDGGRVHLRVFARPLFDERGEVTHVVESFTDITREVLAERARAEGESRLGQAQRMDSIGNLAGGVAHDFNNLLATIKILSSLLRAGESDPARLTAFAQIDQVTDSAAKLTRSLLGFARRGKNLSQRVSLDAAARSVAEIVGRTVDRRIEVRFEGEAVDVVGDATQLEQVIMNLLLNARDAIEGAGTITVRTGLVEVDAARAAKLGALAPGPHAVLEVIDTGTGIDPAVRDRIFEPYFTTRAAGSGHGTGLGLAVVYGVAQSHRGAVEVAPNQPCGTTMRVLLPAA
ncbi:MAG: Sensory box histidine kinase/response regulator, partial [Myxococcaceae bacterium]|nr:Sensory box histidine kinase/response regulator [Myxococcaceae bacterium]